MRFFTAQTLKELVCHIDELGFYSEIYGHTQVLSREMAQFELVTYGNCSLISCTKCERGIGLYGIKV